MANLVTKAEYKAYAGISSTNHDTEIDLLIPKVSQLVKTYCNSGIIDYYSEQKVQDFNGGYEALLLKEAPVVQVISVEYSADYGQTYTELVEYTDWVLDQETNQIVSTQPTGFPQKLKGYRVSYFAGYETTPEDLKLAVMDLLNYYRRNDGAVHSNKAPSANGIQIEYVTNTNFPAHIKRVLDQYRVDYA